MSMDLQIRELRKYSVLNEIYEVARKSTYQFTKRAFDIACGLFGCICLAPIALVVKVCYMLNGDFAKIIYTQKRIGQYGKEIRLYKFRSMVPNADEELRKLLKIEKYKKEWEANQKFDDDPRITKIGRILRKTSLDELPQFINVIRGDMSLIGPRPLVAGELDAHNGNHEIYESIRPGITGWWGCNGRSATTYEKRLELEYYYVWNASVKLDIKCVLKTIQAVLVKDGAK